MVKLLRYILFPFSIIYGLIIDFRNFLFEKNILKASEFDVKTIQVGNLSAGGTGKTPHVEYLIRLLKGGYKTATLSRGYGRIKTGYQKAKETSTAQDIGDEPLQFYSKFDDITVYVDAKRVNGIINIMSQEEVPEIVIMDDAFQHRAIKSGFSILLTDYSSPFYKDFMLPTGNLREFPKGKKRADVIVVTKCPIQFTEEDQAKIKSKLKPDTNQAVFFSRIKYGKLRSVWDASVLEFDSIDELLLITGIANPKPLMSYLEEKNKELIHLKFPDHHSFTDKNIQNIITTFENIKAKNKFIVTTEKDAMRLKSYKELEKFSVYYLDIEIDIINKKNEFDKLIKNYAKAN